MWSYIWGVDHLWLVLGSCLSHIVLNLRCSGHERGRTADDDKSFSLDWLSSLSNISYKSQVFSTRLVGLIGSCIVLVIFVGRGTAQSGCFAEEMEKWRVRQRERNAWFYLPHSFVHPLVRSISEGLSSCSEYCRFTWHNALFAESSSPARRGLTLGGDPTPKLEKQVRDRPNPGMESWRTRCSLLIIRRSRLIVSCSVLRVNCVTLNHMYQASSCPSLRPCDSERMAVIDVISIKI